MTERTAEVTSKRVDRFSQRYRAHVREQLKETLPTLTYRDIRRYREPYHLALCQELHEDQFEQSALYVERLLKLEQDIRQLAGPGTAEWVRPQLRNQIDFLNKLRIGLTEAEQARTQGQAGFDCGAYLQVGLFFMQKPATWWWLAEQLLLQAVAAGRRCKTDGGRREAIARYVYGSFLLDQLEDARAAHKQLEAARKLSAGREWVSERDMGVELDSVFAAASLRLHDATVALIKQTRPNDPRGAVRLRFNIQYYQKLPEWCKLRVYIQGLDAVGEMLE
ncbi:uncharacterized protein LOC126235481 [Schistocerca nitens]|uniref:uncharacterized protein LOC126235481 n=1 Tax=Schistocerca nitens TaxID=7011 RepID=UPI0021179ACD|nr:uncharacterized protein LOC126235481 [Schistocerca nitens]